MENNSENVRVIRLYERKVRGGHLRNDASAYEKLESFINEVGWSSIVDIKYTFDNDNFPNFAVIYKLNK